MPFQITIVALTIMHASFIELSYSFFVIYTLTNGEFFSNFAFSLGNLETKRGYIGY